METDEPGRPDPVEGSDEPMQPSAAYDARVRSRRSSFGDRETRRRAAFDARERTRRLSYDSCETTRQSLVATGEFYRSFATAVVDAFEAFNSELDPEIVGRTGLTRSTFEAIAEGNATFYDSLADASRRVFDELRPDVEREWHMRYEPIDYELLAKLVAAELRAQSPPT